MGGGTQFIQTSPHKNRIEHKLGRKTKALVVETNPKKQNISYLVLSSGN